MTSPLSSESRPHENPAILVQRRDDFPLSPPESHTIHSFEYSLSGSCQLQFSSEDKILSKLLSLGIIDQNWVVQEPYASKVLESLVVDPIKWQQIKNEQIAVSPRGGPFTISFSRLLDICHIASADSTTGISEFVIHGSFVPYLLNERALRECLIELVPEMSAAIENLLFSFSYSDIDLRMTAQTSVNTTGKSFRRVFNLALIHELITKSCLFEIHAWQYIRKSINTVPFDELLAHLKQNQGFNINALVLYNPVSESRIYFSQVQLHAFFSLGNEKNWQRLFCVDYIYSTFFREWDNVSGTEEVLRINPVDGEINVNADRVKLYSTKTPIDVVYSRIDTGATSRMSHQEIRVDLLTHVKERKSPIVRTNLQAVIDLCCGITHWTKEEVTKYDFFAYIFTITSGRRFPNREAEEKVKKQYQLEKNWYGINPITDLLTFNKLENQSDDFKVVCLLNALMVIGGSEIDFKTEFLQLSPEHPVLKEIVHIIVEGKLELTTLSASLQVAAVISLHDAENSRLNVNIVSHLGAPHFKITFDNGSLLLPIHLGNAWDVLTNGNAGIREYQNILGVDFCLIPQRNPILESADQLVQVMKIGAEALLPHFDLSDEIVIKLARFLLLNQLQLYPDDWLFAVCLNQEFGRIIQQNKTEETVKGVFLGAVTCFEAAQKKELENLVQVIFSQKEQESTRIDTLLLMSNETLFTLGLKWAKHLSHDCTACIEYYLGKRKILRALRLMELIEGIVPTKWLQTTANILTNSSRLREFNPELQDPLLRFGKMLKSTLSVATARIDWLTNKPQLLAIFDAYKLQDVVEVLEKAIEDDIKQQNQIKFDRDLEEFESHPALDSLKELLQRYPEFEQRIQEKLIALWPCFVKQHANVFLVMMQDDLVRAAMVRSMTQQKLQELIYAVVNAISASAYHLLKVLEYPELTTAGHFLTLLEKAAKISNEERKNEILELVKKNVNPLLLIVEERRRYWNARFHMEAARKIKDFEEYDLCLRILIQTYDGEKQVPVGQFLDIYKNTLVLQEAVNATLLTKIAITLRHFIKERITKSEEKKLLLRMDLRFLVLGLEHYDGSDDTVLDIANEYIFQDAWNKNDLATFQKALLKVVSRQGFNRQNLAMTTIIFAAIHQLNAHDFYADFIDTLVGECKDATVTSLVNRELYSFAKVYTLKSKGKIPRCYLAYLSDQIDKMTDLDSLVTVGGLMGQFFVPAASREEFQKLQRKFFANYFVLLFSETGVYAEASLYFWNEVTAVFAPAFGKYTDPIHSHKLTLNIPDLRASITEDADEDDTLNGLLFFKELFQLVISTADSCVTIEKMMEIDYVSQWERIKKGMLEKCPFMKHFLLLASNYVSEETQPLQILVEELNKVNPVRTDLVLIYRTIWQYLLTFTRDLKFAPYFDKFAMQTYPNMNSFDRRIFETETNLTYSFLVLKNRVGLDKSLQLKTVPHVVYRILFSDLIIYRDWVPGSLIDKALDFIFDKIVKKELHLSGARIHCLIYHYIAHWKDRFPLKCIKTVCHLALFSQSEPMEIGSVEAVLLALADGHSQYVKACKAKNGSELLELHPLMNAFFNHYVPYIDPKVSNSVEIFSKRMTTLNALQSAPSFHDLQVEIEAEKVLCLQYGSQFLDQKHADFITTFHFCPNVVIKIEMMNLYLEFIRKLQTTDELKFLKDITNFPKLWHEVFLAQVQLISFVPESTDFEKHRLQSIGNCIFTLLEWWDSCPVEIVIQDYITLLQRLTPYIPYYTSRVMTIDEREVQLTRLIKIYVYALNHILVQVPHNGTEAVIIKTIFSTFLEQVKNGNRVLHKRILNNIHAEPQWYATFKSLI